MKNLSIIFAFVLFATIMNAQSAAISTSSVILVSENIERGTEKIDAFGEVIQIDTNTNILISGFYRTAKPVANNFSGYTIQLVTSSRELAKEDNLYQEFGGIMVEENLNPKFAYLVGQFNTQEGAEKYLNTVISNRYENAVVVKFVNGKRTNK